MGYRGSGKSAVGLLLGHQLGRPVIDSDAWIESHVGKAIPAIFEEDGEEAFRQWETMAIEQLPDDPPLVVSLGGGAVLREVNRRLLQRKGRIVWLRADPATLAKRIASDAAGGVRRPSLTGQDPVQEIEHVLSVREPIYRALADWVLETDNRTPSELARAIADWYNLLGS